MITGESLQQKYAQIPTEDLLEMANDKFAYTPIANDVAFEELTARGISIDEITHYEPVVRKIDDATKENCLIDLSVYEKILFFFVMWIPKSRIFYQPDFISDGYILKRTQSNYYSVLGVIAIMTALGLSSTSATSFVSFFAVWLSLFILCFFADLAFNRERQIKKIQKAIEQEELPWGF